MKACGTAGYVRVGCHCSKCAANMQRRNWISNLRRSVRIEDQNFLTLIRAYEEDK